MDVLREGLLAANCRPRSKSQARVLDDPPVNFFQPGPVHIPIFSVFEFFSVSMRVNNVRPQLGNVGWIYRQDVLICVLNDHAPNRLSKSSVSDIAAYGGPLGYSAVQEVLWTDGQQKIYFITLPSYAELIASIVVHPKTD